MGCTIPYTIFPMVCSLEPPTGHLLSSKRSPFLCMHMSRMLDPISKTESMPVAKSDRDADEMAAYTE